MIADNFDTMEKCEAQIQLKEEILPNQETISLPSKQVVPDHTLQNQS
jgi:hypothetical protein